jgi:hypothetical protein
MENLLIRAWKNKGAILEGLKNNVFKKQHVEDVYNHRLQICNGCESIDKTGDNCAMPGTQPCCGECGCSLAIKLRSLSAECDLKKWRAEVSEEEEDAINAYLEDTEGGFGEGQL